MGKILEKLMKKYWKNGENTGKVDEKILEKCKTKTGKVREIRQSKKVGTMRLILHRTRLVITPCAWVARSPHRSPGTTLHE